MSGSQRLARRVINWLASCCLLIACAVANASAQDSQRPPDKITVNQRVKFAAGKSAAQVARSIRRGTTHNYLLRAKAGQRMSVGLTAKGRTSLTIYTPTDRIREADGVTEWQGELNESGDYTIQIATDLTTRYTLDIDIR